MLCLCTEVALTLCTVQLYGAVISSDHRDLSRKNPFDHASLSNKETGDVSKALLGLTTSLMKLEDLNQNTFNNNGKGSQLKRFRRIMIQLRMIWKLRLKLMFINL